MDRGKEIKTQNKNNENAWKLRAWNMRSIHGKQTELIHEFQEPGWDILVLSQAKKGIRKIYLTKGYTLISRGVPIIIIIL